MHLTAPQGHRTRIRRPRDEHRYLAALFADSVGNGLWAPLVLIFFTRAQHLPLGAAGAALTAGGLIGLSTGPFSGALVDRWAPLHLIRFSNALRGAVFLAYPLVTTLWQLVLLAAVFSACERLFWTANTPALEQLVGAGELLRVLGRQNMLRTVGWMAGAGLAALVSVPLLDRPERLHLAAWLNGSTFWVAFVLMPAVRAPARTAPHTAHRDAATAPGSPWRQTLADRPFLLVCLVQTALALISDILTVMLPLVALTILHGPRWLPAAALIASSVSLLCAQKQALRLGRRASTAIVLRLACLFFAAAFLVLAPAAHLAAVWAVPVVLCAATVGAMGDALFGPVLTAAAHEAAPTEYKGRYSAVFQLAWGVASVLAPMVGANLLTAGNAALWLVLTCLCGTTAVLTGFLPRKAPA